jgi:hypothetical protein
MRGGEGRTGEEGGEAWPRCLLTEIGGGKLTLRRGISLAWQLLWLREKGETGEERGGYL